MNQQDIACASSESGWFSLLTMLIKNMLDNSNADNGQAFLEMTGESLAERFPLVRVQSVAALARQINGRLAQFGWGFVELIPQTQALTIHHFAVPQDEQLLASARWLPAMGAVLCGLYRCWLHAQGGGAAVPMTCAINTDNELIFTYQ